MEFVYCVVGFVLGSAVVAGLMLLKGKAAVAPPPAKPSTPPPPILPKANGTPVRALAMLQAEARLVDFLMEDISGASDAQIVHAVRDIQQKAQAAIKQHLVLEPVMTESEGSTVTVPAGFDPSKIRVLGNVTGAPPFTGTLQHAGWRVKDMKLPAPPANADDFVIQPAEVLLS